MSDSSPQKTFKVRCGHCSEPFFVRFPLAQPGVEGSGDVKVTCQYCQQDVMITIPQQYIEQDMMVRGLKSSPT